MELSWKDLLIYILQSVVAFVVSFGIPYLASLIKKKVKNEELGRVIDRAEKIVTDSVSLINQTFVDALKEADKFGVEEQKAAFEMCKQKVLSLLNAEAIEAIYQTYGDLEQWLKTQIEANVRNEKMFKIEPLELDSAEGVEVEG